MSVEKTSYLCVELICCDVKLDSCERSHFLPKLLQVNRTKFRTVLNTWRGSGLTYSGNTSQADDQKTDRGRLILSEEEHLPPYKPQGQGYVHSNE